VPRPKQSSDDSAASKPTRPPSKSEAAILRHQARLVSQRNFRKLHPRRAPKHEHTYILFPDGTRRCHICELPPPWKEPE
jgi:hypothetical protein